MKSFPAILDRPDGDPEQHEVHDRVLTRLITFSFASVPSVPAPPPAHATPLRDTFRDFAEAYFTLALDGEFPSQPPAPREQSTEALTAALARAVASGALAPLPASPRLVATLILTNLAALQQQVDTGILPPTEAADLFGRVLFEGLQASPSPPRPTL